VASWVRIDPAAPAAPVPSGPAVVSQTATPMPCTAPASSEPPATTTPAPAPTAPVIVPEDPAAPVVVPEDRAAPRASVTSASASVRGRAVTVRLRLRSDEAGSVRVGLARVGRGAGVTPARRWRSPVALGARRARSLVVTARLAGGVPPRRLRVTLRVVDRAGNVRRVVRVVPLVRTSAPRS